MHLRQLSANRFLFSLKSFKINKFKRKIRSDRFGPAGIMPEFFIEIIAMSFIEKILRNAFEHVRIIHKKGLVAPMVSDPNQILQDLRELGALQDNSVY